MDNILLYKVTKDVYHIFVCYKYKSSIISEILWNIMKMFVVGYRYYRYSSYKESSEWQHLVTDVSLL